VLPRSVLEAAGFEVDDGTDAATGAAEGGRGRRRAQSSGSASGAAYSADEAIAMQMQNELFLEQIRADPELAMYLLADPRAAAAMGIRIPRSVLEQAAIEAVNNDNALARARAAGGDGGRMGTFGGDLARFPAPSGRSGSGNNRYVGISGPLPNEGPWAAAHAANGGGGGSGLLNSLANAGSAAKARVLSLAARLKRQAKGYSTLPPSAAADRGQYHAVGGADDGGGGYAHGFGSADDGHAGGAAALVRSAAGSGEVDDGALFQRSAAEVTAGSAGGATPARSDRIRSMQTPQTTGGRRHSSGAGDIEVELTDFPTHHNPSHGIGSAGGASKRLSSTPAGTFTLTSGIPDMVPSPPPPGVFAIDDDGAEDEGAVLRRSSPSSGGGSTITSGGGGGRRHI
jgi:hypothetical protein